MAYRKIVVNGVEHQYVIGRSIVKFRTGSFAGHLVPLSEIGVLDDDRLSHKHYIVTPGTIRCWILTGKVPNVSWNYWTYGNDW